MVLGEFRAGQRMVEGELNDEIYSRNTYNKAVETTRDVSAVTSRLKRNVVDV